MKLCEAWQWLDVRVCVCVCACMGACVQGGDFIDIAQIGVYKPCRERGRDGSYPLCSPKCTSGSNPCNKANAHVFQSAKGNTLDCRHAVAERLWPCRVRRHAELLRQTAAD